MVTKVEWMIGGDQQFRSRFANPLLSEQKEVTNRVNIMSS